MINPAKKQLSEKTPFINAEVSDTVSTDSSQDSHDNESKDTTPSRLDKIRTFLQKPNSSIWLLTLCAALGNLTFSVVVPSLLKYLINLENESSDSSSDSGGSDVIKTFFGICVAAYSVGQFLGSPFFGFWGNRRPVIEPLIASFSVSLVGNVMYATAYDKWVLLAARLLVGFGAGNVTTIRAYVSQVSAPESRTAVMANLSAATGLSFILGPLLGAALDTFHIPLPKISNYSINGNTSPGYLSSLICVICILTISLCFYQAPDYKDRVQAEQQQQQQQQQESISESESQDNDDGSDSNTSSDIEASDEGYEHTRQERGVSWRRLGYAACMLTFFVITSMFAMFEAVGVAYVQDKNHYDWDIIGTGILFGGAGIVALFTYVGISFINRCVPDRIMLISGLTIALAGFCNLISIGMIPLWRFILSATVISIGYPTSQAIMFSIYSKAIPPSKQGMYMSFMTASGSCARVFGPVWSTAVYPQVHPRIQAAVVFGATAGMIFLCILLVLSVYPLLVPHPLQQKRGGKPSAK